jgi:hypothetical protein
MESWEVLYPDENVPVPLFVMDTQNSVILITFKGCIKTPLASEVFTTTLGVPGVKRYWINTDDFRTDFFNIGGVRVKLTQVPSLVYFKDGEISEIRSASLFA